MKCILYIFEYKSVKLEIDEGLIKGENRTDETSKEGYRSCDKFNKGKFELYKILCFLGYMIVLIK